MSKVIKLKKGLDIRLKGKADKIYAQPVKAEFFAVKPIDFPGLTPKLKVKVDDKVKAGSTIFFDKYRPEVQFTSPVSGTVMAVQRGDRRRILEVVIKADSSIEYETFKSGKAADLSKDEIIENLLNSGLWPFIRQRPYAIVANPQDTPKSIFISAFDSAPLAPDYDFVLSESKEEFQAGIDVLAKLTDGKVNLNLHSSAPACKTFTEAKNVELNTFSGSHPSGSIGVQIHHIDPINKGDIVWYVNVQDVVSIGKLFEKGVYDASRVVALTGPEVIKPWYHKTMIGASIEPMVHSNVTQGKKVRCISGNVLTGTKIQNNGYIGFYDSQVTVLEEGDKFEFLGWALPGLKKFSASRAFFSWLTPKKEYNLNTNTNGGHRAFVLTNQYDKVLPMDILPVHLIKAIMVNDIDLMEQLGIYEIAEEDVALCDFVCTSKIEVQQTVRDGIEVMIKELG